VALKSKLKSLPSQGFVVASETVNCCDLADGIASVSQSGWKVTVLHRGGLDTTGVVGIRLEPDSTAGVEGGNRSGDKAGMF